MNNTRTDSEALAARFTVKELRKELHTAEVNCLPDQDDYDFWLWYADVVRGAILFKRANQPAPQSMKGHIDIEAIRERTDIVSLAENYGLKVHKSGRNFKARCPFHTDKSPSFYIYPDEKRFHCFGCQADGDFIDLIMKLDNISFKEAVSKC